MTLLLNELTSVFEVSLTSVAGQYRFSQYPKCGDFIVDFNDNSIRMRWDKVDYFHSDVDLTERLLYWWDWWVEVANSVGCPYTDCGQREILNTLLKEL